jgi:hypothetical protein
MCDKATYMRYLRGEGIRYGNTNLYIIRNNSTTKSTEERALQKIAPLCRLNPDYANPRATKQEKVSQTSEKKSRIGRQIVQAFLNGPR